MRATRIKTTRLRRRVRRVRKKVHGISPRPRLSVARSNHNIEAQIIDDMTGRTLCAASSRLNEIRDRCGYGGNVTTAAAVGKLIGEKAMAIGIERVAFDRRGRKYHGRIKALAEAAREAGLNF